MKITGSFLNFNIRANFKNSVYSSPDFLEQNKSPKETDLVNFVINEVELDSKNSPMTQREVLYSIGKIFENAGSLNTACQFFEKIKENSFANSKPEKDIDCDLSRVYEKISLTNRSWQG